MSWVVGKILGRVIDLIEQRLAKIFCAHLVFDEMPNRDFSSRDELISVFRITFGQSSACQGRKWGILRDCDMLVLVPVLFFFSLLFLIISLV